MTDAGPTFFTPQHEWLRLEDGVVIMGITAYAQEALGDIVFVSLPAVGTAVQAGAACGEVESTKSVSDVYAPVSGTVEARNDDLSDAPETINADPYGGGWLVRIRLSDDSFDPAAFLDEAAYRALTAGPDAR